MHRVWSAVPLTAVVLAGGLCSCASARSADAGPPDSIAVVVNRSTTFARLFRDAGADAHHPDVAEDTAMDSAADASADVVTPTDVPIASDVPVMGTDVPPPYDAGPGTDVLPAFDEATDAHVRSIVALGLARGNRHDVFAKIGDSITESQSYLYDCGFGWYDLGSYRDLEATISYFRVTTIGITNSFNRASVCAAGGWACSDALAGSPDALTREIDATQPLWAIVMYGTNDMQRYDLGTFGTNLATILDTLEARGVVPVVSTIPSRADTEPYISMVPSFNATIRNVASTRHLPLIDLNVALAPLPDHGVSPDGIHPNVWVNPSDGSNDGCVFTDTALQFGYNMRNLTTIQMLSRLRTY